LLTKCQEKKEEPLTVATLWDTVFLSFGSFSLLFAFKKKENEQAFSKKRLDCHVALLLAMTRSFLVSKLKIRKGWFFYSF